jgi:hypothetical protein
MGSVFLYWYLKSFHGGYAFAPIERKRGALREMLVRATQAPPKSKREARGDWLRRTADSCRGVFI